jgi:TIGR03009 family protein
MRLSGLALACTLLGAATAPAQQPPPRLPAASPPAASPAPAPVPVDPVLDGYLRRWEQEMQRFQTLAVEFNRVDRDKVTRSDAKYNGRAYFMKTGTGPSARNLVLLETYREGSKEIAEKFVCSGTFFYLYSPSAKEIQAREIPRTGPGSVPDDNFLGMFGLRAEEAKRRYVLKLAKEDANYVYVDVLPRFARDQAEFDQAQVVLYKKTFIPVQIWYQQKGQSESVWSIDTRKVHVNAQMDQRWFDQPQTPPGWKFIRIPPDADAKPTVIRNSGAP